MRLIESLKKKKFILLNIFLTLYIGINLIGGERGLISYFDKKNTYDELIKKDKDLTIIAQDFGELRYDKIINKEPIDNLLRYAVDSLITINVITFFHSTLLLTFL